MNSHEQYAALLDAFIDGALTDAEAGRVRTHLTECAECQAYVTDALTMRELFPGIEETVVPDGFAETVLSGLPPQNVPAQARSNPRRTQARNVRRRAQWTRFALPLAACVTLALLVGGLWRELPMNRAISGGAPETSASGAAVADMTQNATVTAADVEESASDLDEALPDSASDFDEVTGSASDFDEALPDSASDLDGGVAYNAKSAASDGGARSESVADGGAIGNDTVDAVNGSSASGASNPTAQNGAARKRTYETPETEESALFDFGVTAPTIYDYTTPSLETPTLDAPRNKALDGGDTMPPQNAETDAMPPQNIETYAALQSGGAPQSTENGVTSDTTENGAAPVPEPLEPQRASGVADASAESVPAESVAVSYWTLSPDAAPRLEQYAVVKETASGAWYALNPEQFDALREGLPESAFTPMDVDSLSADDAPPIRDRAPVYVFLPFS